MIETPAVAAPFGKTAIRLARRFACQVTGITLSGVQRRWAALAARLQGVGRRATFSRTDAEAAAFPPGSFDVVWSIECTEHLFDKPAFFRRTAGCCTSWAMSIATTRRGCRGIRACRSARSPA